MSSTALARSAAVLLALVAGCGSDFDSRTLIKDFRILAMQTSPPWFVRGEEAVTRVLTAGEPRGTTAPTYRWSWCLLRGSNDQGFACLLTPELMNQYLEARGLPALLPSSDLGTNPTASLSLDIPPEVFENEEDTGFCSLLRSPDGPLGEISRFVTLPDCNGTYPISFEVQIRDGDRTLYGFTSQNYVYDPRVELNAQPDISALDIRVVDRVGNPLEQPLEFEKSYLFELSNDEGLGEDRTRTEQLQRLSETFSSTTSPNAPRQHEQLSLSWFSTTGDWDAPRTGYLPSNFVNDAGEVFDREAQIQEWVDARTNELELPKPAELDGTSFDVTIVIRDGRGGLSWVTKTFDIGASQ